MNHNSDNNYKNHYQGTETNLRHLDSSLAPQVETSLFNEIKAAISELWRKQMSFD